ncbi:DUF2249 domain-containing protein [Hydrogenimonas sp.]
MEVVALDVRGLSHPEPLERSVAAFKKLKEGVVLHLRIHRLPTPLLQIAEARGIRYFVHEAGEGDWHILFTQDEKVDLSEAIGGLAHV